MSFTITTRFGPGDEAWRVRTVCACDFSMEHHIEGPLKISHVDIDIEDDGDSYVEYKLSETGAYVKTYWEQVNGLREGRLRELFATKRLALAAIRRRKKIEEKRNG